MVIVESFYSLLLNLCIDNLFLHALVLKHHPIPLQTHTVTYVPHKLLQIDNRVTHASNIFASNNYTSDKSTYQIQKNGTRFSPHYGI